jgi:hypothetical protein
MYVLITFLTLFIGNLAFFGYSNDVKMLVTSTYWEGIALGVLALGMWVSGLHITEKEF